jgi:hypothetical protein
MTRIQIPELAGTSLGYLDTKVGFDEKGVAFVDDMGLLVMQTHYPKSLVVLEKNAEVEDLKPATELVGEVVHSEEAGMGEGTKIGDFEAAPDARPLPEAEEVPAEEAPAEGEAEAEPPEAAEEEAPSAEPEAAEEAPEQAPVAEAEPAKRGPGRPRKDQAGK